MAKVKPSIRLTETYTESNFVRLHTIHRGESPAAAASERLVTIEHLCYSAANGTGKASWRCQTIVDAEPMSKEDALFIARSYAQEFDVPVIYECHSD